MIFSKIIESEFDLTVIKEFKFHPTRKWRIDYFIPVLKLAIECEGGAWTQGRHTRGKGFINDLEKYNEITIAGYRLLRFTPDQLMTMKPIEFIKRIIAVDKNSTIH